MRSAALMAPDVGRGACLSGSVTGGSGTTPPSDASGAAACWADSETGIARANAIRVKNDLMSRMGKRGVAAARGAGWSGTGWKYGRGRRGKPGRCYEASRACEAPSKALDAGTRGMLPEGFEQLRLHERQLLHPGVGGNVHEERAVARNHARRGDGGDLFAHEHRPLVDDRRLLDAFGETGAVEEAGQRLA